MNSCTRHTPFFHTHLRSSAAVVVCIFACIAMCMLPTPAYAADFKIVYPSDTETTIAPGRDFYVIGTGDDLQTKGVKVELLEGARGSGAAVVRSLTYDPSYKLAENKAVPAISHFYNDKTNPVAEPDLVMPDLSYSTAVPGSERNPAVKISATDQNFAALIFGGESDSLGITAESKLEGTYTLRVTIGGATSSTSDDQTLEKTLLFASVEDKVASRFSPDDHLANVKAAALEQGYRTYIDPFPGYWSPQNLGCIYYFGQLYTKRDVFLESYPRWRTADALEYQTGNVHLYLYNINPTSTTQAVEIAAVQRTNRIDADLNCIYYDIGEPSLVNNGETLTGTFVNMEPGDKLAFTRSQANTEVGEDNQFATYVSYNDALDTTLSDGIEADAGQEIALFGVAAPIQNDAADIIDNGDYSYTAGNDVDSIRYEFVRDGAVAYAETKSVDLLRDFSETWTNAESTYEFKHCFTLTDSLGAGTYQVNATALDTHGNIVEGGTETFTLNVNGETPAPPTPTPSPAETSPTYAPLASTGDNQLAYAVLLFLCTSCATGSIYFAKRRGMD